MDNHYSMDQLIAHRGKMSLLDKVQDYGDNWLEASAKIAKDNLFLDNTQLPIWIGIEYMAQAIAAFAGIRAIEQGRKVKLGFLVGSRKYQCQSQGFAIGSEVRVKVTELIMGDNGLGSFECEIFGQDWQGQSAWAKANLNVYQPDNIDEILKDTP